MDGEGRHSSCNDGATAMKIETEGTILLSPTGVDRDFVFQQLKKTLQKLRELEAIR